MTNDDIMNGVPINIYLKYARAYGSIVSVEPKRISMSSINAKPNAAIIIPVKRAVKNPADAISSALLLSLAPNARDI